MKTNGSVVQPKSFTVIIQCSWSKDLGGFSISLTLHPHTNSDVDVDGCQLSISEIFGGTVGVSVFVYK